MNELIDRENSDLSDAETELDEVKAHEENDNVILNDLFISTSSQAAVSDEQSEADAKVKSDAFHILQRYSRALTSSKDPWAGAFVA